jgi:hypothetical protein
MQIDINSPKSSLPGLKKLERREELIAYFDLAWEIFVRLERDGKLGTSNLTIPKVNPTVNPPTAPPDDQLTEIP